MPSSQSLAKEKLEKVDLIPAREFIGNLAIRRAPVPNDALTQLSSTDSVLLGQGSSVFGSVLGEQNSVVDLSSSLKDPSMRGMFHQLVERFKGVDPARLMSFLPRTGAPDAGIDWIDVNPSEISVHPYVEGGLTVDAEDGWNVRTRALYINAAGADDDLDEATRRAMGLMDHHRDSEDGEGSEGGSGVSGSQSSSSSSRPASAPSVVSLFHDLDKSSDSDEFVPDENLEAKLNRCC